jgi:hypothetical protein
VPKITSTSSKKYIGIGALCIRVDEGGHELIGDSCETCGHKLSLEEVGRHSTRSERFLACKGARR